LPPALAKALEPKVERAISLRLGDFVEQIPVDYIKPIEVIDANRSVDLKASEIEKGMAERNPTIPLPSLYQQLPEIFLRAVTPDDSTRVALPYEKVLEQFTNLRVRDDQLREARIPLVDTPILQTTIEDSERFGTKVEPLVTSEFPPLAVEPATAKAIAKAEPEAVARETVRLAGPKPSPPHPVISLSLGDMGAFSKPDLPASPANPEPVPASPAKIPFDFPPNGTGAPASERVPASSGPPVPTISASVATPARIPFNPPEEIGKAKTSAPTDTKALEPAATEKVPAAAPAETPAATDAPLVPVAESSESSKTSETKIRLALKPLLQNLPPFQIDGDINAVAEDIHVEFPLSLVESQLPTGRVFVPAKIFQQALPESHRTLFVTDPAETPVALPLSEVLKSVPKDVLQIRTDQENVSDDLDFETQFSLRAKEDAERFQAATVTVSKPSEGGADQTEGPGHEKEKIDGKEVVARACQFAGVEACEIIFPHGLSLAGNFPSEVAADGLCAMAPTLLQRIETHMIESRLGSLEAVTVRSAQSAITFFIKPNICLAALHRDAASLPSETRTGLGELAEKLSQTFVQPEAPHVDH
jgi:predicted regulator of Ras-like GTPase activity (Roadblock/LC7/MglB family)